MESDETLSDDEIETTGGTAIAVGDGRRRLRRRRRRC